MTYDEATRHATWEESFVYALGCSVERDDPAWRRLGGLGFGVMKYALARELTLADRDPYEHRLLSYPWGSRPAPGVVLS